MPFGKRQVTIAGGASKNTFGSSATIAIAQNIGIETTNLGGITVIGGIPVVEQLGKKYLTTYKTEDELIIEKAILQVFAQIVQGNNLGINRSRLIVMRDDLNRNSVNTSFYNPANNSVFQNKDAVIKSIYVAP